jgi:hypothetical protein
MLEEYLTKIYLILHHLYFLQDVLPKYSSRINVTTAAAAARSPRQ